MSNTRFPSATPSSSLSSLPFSPAPTPAFPSTANSTRQTASDAAQSGSAGLLSSLYDMRGASAHTNDASSGVGKREGVAPRLGEVKVAMKQQSGAGYEDGGANGDCSGYRRARPQGREFPQQGSSTHMPRTEDRSEQQEPSINSVRELFAPQESILSPSFRPAGTDQAVVMVDNLPGTSAEKDKGRPSRRPFEMPPTESFAIRCPSPAPASHVPYVYSFELPSDKVGSILLGFRGGTLRYLGEEAGAVKLFVEFYPSGGPRATMFIVGSENAVKRCLGLVDEQLYRKQFHKFNVDEQSSLTSSKEWLQLNLERLERLVNLCLLNQYASRPWSGPPGSSLPPRPKPLPAAGSARGRLPPPPPAPLKTSATVTTTATPITQPVPPPSNLDSRPSYYQPSPLPGKTPYHRLPSTAVQAPQQTPFPPQQYETNDSRTPVYPTRSPTQEAVQYRRAEPEGQRCEVSKRSEREAAAMRSSGAVKGHKREQQNEVEGRIVEIFIPEAAASLFLEGSAAVSWIRQTTHGDVSLAASSTDATISVLRITLGGGYGRNIVDQVVSDVERAVKTKVPEWEARGEFGREPSSGHRGKRRKQIYDKEVRDFSAPPTPTPLYVHPGRHRNSTPPSAQYLHYGRDAYTPPPPPTFSRLSYPSSPAYDPPMHSPGGQDGGGVDRPGLEERRYELYGQEEEPYRDGRGDSRRRHGYGSRRERRR